MTNKNKPLLQIREIGDAILHKPGCEFPRSATKEQLSELLRQIEIAKNLLIETGGAGIAANQCVAIGENPYQFTIVGVFHDNARHVANVTKRYPGVEFPDAVMMINPKIVETSQDTMIFSHGCLSVPGNIRGEIETPVEISVEYITLNNEKKCATMRGLSAVVLQHELNHIIFGMTYLDRALLKLSNHDLQMMQQLLQAEILHHDSLAIHTEEQFYRIITINAGVSTFHDKLFAEVLKKGMTLKTMRGLLGRIDKVLS